MDDGSSTATAIPGVGGTMGEFPPEVLRIVTEYLDVPRIPSPIEPHSRGINGLFRLRVNKTWIKWVDKENSNEGASGLITLYAGGAALGTTSDRPYPNETDTAIPRLRKSTIVIAAGFSPLSSDRWEEVCRIERETRDLLEKAKKSRAFFRKVGTVVFDSRLTSPALTESDDDACSISERQPHKVKWSQALSFSAEFANHIDANLRFEDHNDLRPNIGWPPDFSSQIPQRLMWNGRTTSLPHWGKEWLIPDYVDHTYSIDYTETISTGLSPFLESHFTRVVRNKLELITGPAGEHERTHILFHVPVDPSDTEATENFAGISFQKAFDAVFDEAVPGDLRNAHKLELRIGGENPITELPYEVVK